LKEREDVKRARAELDRREDEQRKQAENRRQRARARYGDGDLDVVISGFDAYSGQYSKTNLVEFLGELGFDTRSALDLVDPPDRTKLGVVMESVSREGARDLTANLVQRGAYAGVAHSLDIRDAAKWWASPTPGSYTVELTGIGSGRPQLGGKIPAANAPKFVLPILEGLPRFQEAGQDAETAVQRAIHISPEPIAEGVSEDYAIRLKELIEARGGRVRIRATNRTGSESARRPIPEAVRHEVWRRDSGRCVDCGSREELEFDHIVPVSKGGSNTARNIELRCESCNRRKAARI
jgi:hypothetical protein